MLVLILLQVGLQHRMYICILSGLPKKEDVELPELSENKRKFTVLGAGVVGLCCAVSLQRAGFSVTLLDRLDPGTGTSFGNAGLIQIDSVVPIATPGI